MKLRPLGERVFVEPLTRALETKLIILPQNAGTDSNHFGRVLAVGRKLLKDGTTVPCLDGIEPGDMILYTRAGGWDREIRGQEVVSVSPNYILAKLTDGARVEHHDSQGVR